MYRKIQKKSHLLPKAYNAHSHTCICRQKAYFTAPVDPLLQAIVLNYLTPDITGAC